MLSPRVSRPATAGRTRPTATANAAASARPVREWASMREVAVAAATIVRLGEVWTRGEFLHARRQAG